ncbi:hypothetical protein A2130_02505 [Candidatus Woesebacteria bacterium GWC2_33_12]|uniref:DUF5667 domain-containing protein n=1 Tax=Candidatus Woesebacteria bacterium GW2011_GWB1_33_22 TaxID=1618566 RepID=A0A0G0A0X6_9BACT|nr:MAG: hypothetical protein UR29_C0021G0008 [Candidatus Woesebacteria bacterium GW2011_GWC2_33_12]KKP42018.1 MAG: hypothetical protein UR33_C0006G0002 [Candidatus Woesebacteria bacterium GW2011_GWA2_33_20]KKP44831.1 MAG: hypothetical protein UR35_C0006G0066 [Candidatus Woesebacteria bacterium GW2011_GWB1_33_22]KKP45057.1 MAG: hypothetical protein UR37_C0021G0008 [Microgenomates group bacterium GW2011_GWC1_33_28]KKP50563.1 MAG: hypothetical protein UR41_C0006G0066 [Candidatus Woesebacteria bact
MKSRIAGISATILIAFIILLASLLRSVTPNYAYSPMVLSEKTNKVESVTIDYVLAYQGKILPDNPLWYIKVLRDKIWLVGTFKPVKKAELNLLFADKRLNASLELFKKNKPDLGLSVLTKSGKYLEKSASIMNDDKDFYSKLAVASLKHREVIEEEILPLTPEDLRPQVIKVKDYSKLAYEKVKDKMLSVGLVPPSNPFETK